MDAHPDAPRVLDLVAAKRPLILLAAVTIQAAMYGGHFSFTVFFPSLLDLAGGSRAWLSGVYTLFTLVYTTFMFPVGLLADRWSPRRLVAWSAFVYALGFWLSAVVGSIGQLYVTFGLVAALGMSAGYVVPTASALRSFPDRGGTAVGIASAGVAVGSAAAPPLALRVIETFGWRAAFAAIGTVVLAIVLLSTLALHAAPQVRRAPPDAASEPLAVGEILRAAQFWLLGIVCAANWLPLFAMWTHLFPMGLARGITPGGAAAGVTVFGVASFAGRLIWGIVSDRRGRPLTLGLSLAGQALAFALLAGPGNVTTFFVAVALFGFTSGGSMSLLAVYATDLFGAPSAGRIMGASVAIGGVVATQGPVVAGYLHDVSASYLAAFVLGAALNALALVVFGRLVRRGPYIDPTLRGD
ncbi:MAG: MFS transporter [Candidatus Rokubacteria bacterium]|nr:MFS transporter [Candidatus Rokubacteria bacterium]